MKIICLIMLCMCFSVYTSAQIKTIHVFVALCDNTFQGIVPVSETLGNGKDPKNNLYWGAAYGVKTYFNRSRDWQFIKAIKTENPYILERILFKHVSQNTYLLADAYDGEFIKACTVDFLKSANYQMPLTIDYNNLQLGFGGKAQLLALLGHDGLMDFRVDIDYIYRKGDDKIDVILLSCMSKIYFNEEIQLTQANPLLWTNQLMAPEAYSLKSAIDGWLKNENAEQIMERAAQSYNKYQKCGMKWARKTFATGF